MLHLRVSSGLLFVFVCARIAIAQPVGQLADAHAASLAAIATMRATVAYQLSGGGAGFVAKNATPGVKFSQPISLQSAKFARRGRTIRIDELVSDFGERTLLFDMTKGETSVVPTVKRGEPLLGLVLNPVTMDTRFDYWLDFICLPRASGDLQERYVTFDRAVRDKRYTAVKVVGVDPAVSSAIHVTFELAESGGRTKVAVWLDPAVNHLIRKAIRTEETDQGQIVTEMTVEQFAEPKPGLFLPTKVTQRAKVGKAEFPGVTLTATDLRVNESIPPATFQLAFPVGTRVSDQIRGTTYTVTADGSQAKPGVTFPVAEPPQGESRPTATPADADDPAWPWWKRIVLASALLVILAGAVVWVRRRKSRG